MNSKRYCSHFRNSGFNLLLAVLMGCFLPAFSERAVAGDAPSWMRNLAGSPLPEYAQKTDAILLYSEQIVTVESETKIKTAVRKAYRILRSDGRRYGSVVVPIRPGLKITDMCGWCIPTQGKDYEVKEKDSVEISLPNIDGSELITDIKGRVMQIPAADPGTIVGYQYEQEEEPYALQELWSFQESVPVREAHFVLRLPRGWEYKTTFLNSAEIKPTQSGDQWRWSVRNVNALKAEEDMPAWGAIASEMIVSYFPSGGSISGKGFSNWNQMGTWYSGLLQGRTESSPEVRQKVSSIASGAAASLDKLREIARFMQKEIRYVAIEMGIGGWQPHPAAEVFLHRYGDCKDKVALMITMLREMGIDAYYVLINIERGSAFPEMQPYLGAFNHAIIAIRLPSGVTEATMVATLERPKLGKLVFFDPTNEFVPFGQIAGHLQDNYGLIVTPDGGELIMLPKQPATMNGTTRTARLNLTAQGRLTGDFEEILRGDRAWLHRSALRSATRDADRIKPIETLLSQSLSTFQITKASAVNFNEVAQPFQYRYLIAAQGYAKITGNLMLIRPRVIGTKSRALLETREPRNLPLGFECLSWDSDTFEITLPPGYELEDLPPAVSLDYSFAAYHSKTEVSGRLLRYSRSMEIKELTVPVIKMGELKEFYRAIASDERNTAVLRPMQIEQK
jgi:hypothetical protein